MEFRRVLIEWYEKNKRNLPWRYTSDPYHIWISEVILQQTRVTNGIDYYRRFISRFPDIETLAGADLEQVLKIWQGMGYYSRARYLHETSRQIVNGDQGKFPDNYEDLIKLKGVGEYTAAAILSFSFNMPRPVVDGNVYRVLSRVFEVYDPIDTSIGKKKFSELALSLIDRKTPGIYNQAIMEFGAIQCIPGKPDCNSCPLRNHCMAFRKNMLSSLPVKSKKQTTRERFFNYFHLKLLGKKTVVYQRTDKDIWKSLYEFPLFESEKLIEPEVMTKNVNVSEFFGRLTSVTFKGVQDYQHILTHQKIHARFFQFEISGFNFLNSPYREISMSGIENEVPLHRLILKYFDKNKINY